MRLFYRYIHDGFSHFPALPEKKLHFLAGFDPNQHGASPIGQLGFARFFC